jgi:hypothetical protein
VHLAILLRPWSGWVCWCMPVILAPRRLRPPPSLRTEFESSLGYIARPCLKKPQQNKNNVPPLKKKKPNLLKTNQYQQRP